MTVRESRTRARARTPGAEDDPTSTTVRDRALGPTQCGISDVATKGHEGRTQTKYLPVYAGSSLKLAMFGKAPSEMSALQPYRGKPAVRNDRGDRGNVGIIEARSAPRSYPTIGLSTAPARPEDSTPYDAAGDCCTAGSRSGVCPLWVNSRPHAALGNIRFAPESGHSICAAGAVDFFKTTPPFRARRR